MKGIFTCRSIVYTRVLPLLLLFTFSQLALHAQPANTYVFSAFSTAYTSITGSVPNIQSDDQTQTGIPLGFTFNFAGNNYTTVAMCSNGFMSLNNSPSTQLTNSQANAVGIGPMLMPLWDDLSGTTGTPSTYAYYTTTGTAPNRIFTLECRDWRWNYTGTTGCVSFEIKLYETSNIIDYIYSSGAVSPTNPSATIGIFNTNTDFQTLPDVTASPTPSTSTFYTGLNAKPASGQVYRWAPQLITCTVPGTNYCGGSTVNVSYSSLGITFVAGNVFTVQLSDATGSFASPTVIGTLTSTATSGTIVCTIPVAQAPGTLYRVRVISSSPAVTGQNNGVDITINPTVVPAVTITAAPGNTICAGDNVTFSAAVVNGGPSPTYQWYINGVPVGGNTPTYSSTTMNNGDIVTCIITSNAACAVPTTATSNGITMTVNPNVTPTITITANPGNVICLGQSVTFTTTITNGGPTPTYVWKVNGFPVASTSTYTTSTLVNGDVVTCELTSNAPCVLTPTVVSAPITMTVTPTILPTINITANPGSTACAGANVIFTANITNGGPTPSYQWYVNGNPVGGNSPTYSNNSLASGDIVSCDMTSNATCATPATVTGTMTMTIVPNVTPTINITANPGTTICAGASVTFTANTTNAGPTPSYQWYVNGNPAGNNSSTYTTTALANGDVVTCELTSSAQCANPQILTSAGLTMTVNPVLIPTISLSANPGNSVCVGTNVTFSAASTNGGPTPIYQWFLNGNPVGTNSTVYSNNTLANGDVITCELISNATCAIPDTVMSSTITMIVYNSLTPAITITNTPGNTICAGTSVTFTATPTNGGPTPSYQWYRNGNPVGTNSGTYIDNTLANGDVITCNLTSSAACASPTLVTSNTITMTVIPTVTPTAAITANPGNNICAGTQVTFSASITNGGPTPSYQWKKNGNPVGGNSPTYVDNTLNNTDVVTCWLTSNANCATPVTVYSNNITMGVTSLVIPTVSISVSPGTLVCSGTPVTFTATSTNGGPVPAYQWKVNGNPAGPNNASYTTTTLNAGDVVTCDLTSNAACATPPTITSNSIAMTVTGVTVPGITIAANTPDSICEGTAVTFSAAIVNGGPTPQYLWMKNGYPVGMPTNTYVDSNLYDGDVVSCILTSSDPCPSPVVDTSNSKVMTVHQYQSPEVFLQGVPVICTNTPLTLTAIPYLPGPTPNFQWRLNGLPNGTGPTWTGTGLHEGDLVYCIMTSSAPCVVQNPINSQIDTVHWFNAGYLAGTVGGTETNTVDMINAPSVISYTDCDLISTVTPGGASPVNGSLTAGVTLDNNINYYLSIPYLQRHFDILPASNPSGATATIKLYAYQYEFDAYDSLLLHTNSYLPPLPSNHINNGNVAITEFHGTGTAPGNYSGPAEIIFPTVVWDTAANWWVMTFDVKGFGGFYIHTTTAVFPLSVSNVGADGFSVEAYPNPAYDKIEVKVSGQRNANSKLTITDIAGKVLITSAMDNNKAIIDMSGLASGIYMLRYTDDARTETLKITKQ